MGRGYGPRIRVRTKGRHGVQGWVHRLGVAAGSNGGATGGMGPGVGDMDPG